MTDQDAACFAELCRLGAIALGNMPKNSPAALHALEVCDGLTADPPVDRAALTAHVTYALPELTDGALSQVAAFIKGLDRRPLTADALNAAQRARELAP